MIQLAHSDQKNIPIRVYPPAAARQAEVARDYLKHAARIDELNGHSPGSDGLMVTALKKCNGGPGAGLREGRVRGDAGGGEAHLRHHRPRPGADPRPVLQQRCQAHQGHVQAVHPEDLGAHGAPRLGPSPPRPRPGPHHPRPGAPRRQRCGTWRTAVGPVSSSTAPRTSSPTARRTAAPAVRQCQQPTDEETTRTTTLPLATPRGGEGGALPPRC